MGFHGHEVARGVRCVDTGADGASGGVHDGDRASVNAETSSDVKLRRRAVGTVRGGSCTAS